MFTKGNNTQASKLQSEEQRVTDLTNNLNTLLRATSSNYANSDNFYAEYSNFLAELSGAFQGLRQYASNITNSHNLTQEQAKNRAAEYSRNTEEINAAIQARRTELEGLQGQVREITGRFQPKLWSKLKVKETPALNEYFTNVFKVYYPENVFDWALFKKTEIEKNKLADFNTRLASKDYTQVPESDLNNLDLARNNADVAAIAAKKDGAQLTEVNSFLALVRNIADAQRDIAQLQARSDALRTEFEASEREGVCTHDFAQKRAEHLNALNERMIASAAPFGNVEQRTNEFRQAYQEHKAHLRGHIDAAEAQIRTIPESVYTA